MSNKLSELDLSVIDALKDTMKSAIQQIEDIKQMQQVLLKVIDIQKTHEKKLDILAEVLHSHIKEIPNGNN